MTLKCDNKNRIKLTLARKDFLASAGDKCEVDSSANDLTFTTEPHHTISKQFISNTTSSVDWIIKRMAHINHAVNYKLCTMFLGNSPKHERTKLYRWHRQWWGHTASATVNVANETREHLEWLLWSCSCSLPVQLRKLHQLEALQYNIDHVTCTGVRYQITVFVAVLERRHTGFTLR